MHLVIQPLSPLAWGIGRSPVLYMTWDVHGEAILILYTEKAMGWQLDK
jgi:hypothetical protein